MDDEIADEDFAYVLYQGEADEIDAVAAVARGERVVAVLVSLKHHLADAG